jgi:hypothetical protein
METEKTDNLTPPNLCIFDGKEWDKYADALYEIFLNEIKKGNLIFQGLPVRVKRYPEYKGKDFAFWHLTSDGKKEEERIPDLRRCERLSWVSWVISNYDKTSEICCWQNKRGRHKHFVIWFDENHRYAVILEKRPDYFLLKTQYYMEPHRVKSFISDRDKSFKKNL